MTRGFFLSINADFIEVLYYYQSLIENFYLSINSSFKSSYKEQLSSIDDFITQHFNQKDTIVELKQETARLQKIIVQNISVNFQLNSLLSSNKLSQINYETYSIKPLSYINIKDPYKLWVEFNEFEQGETYGLIQNNMSVGIVTTYKNEPLLVLNQSPKCNYSVYIGKHKASAILQGENQDNELVANYISNKEHINIGDKVVTSGLDGIFLPGYIVGTVTKVLQEIGYKKVFINPYNNIDLSKLLYTIKIPKKSKRADEKLE